MKNGFEQTKMSPTYESARNLEIFEAFKAGEKMNSIARHFWYWLSLKNGEPFR